MKDKKNYNKKPVISFKSLYICTIKQTSNKKEQTMSISSKLAVDFVKRNFDSFDFDNKIKKASEVTRRNVYDAHVRIICADIKLFVIDPSAASSCIMVKLPEKLCGKLGLEEALKQIDKENMGMESYFTGKNKYVRVTTNRLLLLEKLMKKSGFINQINHEVKDQIIEKIAQMQSEAGYMYAYTLNQLNKLSEIIKSK